MPLSLSYCLPTHTQLAIMGNKIQSGRALGLSKQGCSYVDFWWTENSVLLFFFFCKHFDLLCLDFKQWAYLSLLLLIFLSSPKDKKNFSQITHTVFHFICIGMKNFLVTISDAFILKFVSFFNATLGHHNKYLYPKFI